MLLLLTVLVVFFGVDRVSAVAPVPSTLQQDDSPDIEIHVDAFHERNGFSALVVSVRSQRGGRGEIVVGEESNFGSTPDQVVLPIELPPGVTAKVWIALAGANNLISATAKLSNPSRTASAANVLDLRAGNSEAVSVAVLAGASGGRPVPAVTETVVQDVTASLSLVDADVIERQTEVLNAFEVLAVSSRDLLALSEATQADVIAWVRRGGELLVDDDGPVANVEAAPPAGSVTGVPVGRGIIRRTDGALSAGKWREAILPTALGPQFQSGQLLARGDATSSLPAGGALLGGLVLYAVIVGPLLFLMLRRRRPMALWSAAPLLALLTTAGVVAVGRTSRQTDDVGSALLETGVGSSWGYLDRVLSEAGGRREVIIPDGWLASQPTVGFESVAKGVVRVGTPSVLVVEIPPGGTRVVGLAGPLSGRAGLEVTATISSDDPGAVEVTVVNRTGSQLSDVVAAVATHTENIGPMSVGGTATFSVKDAQMQSFIAVEANELPSAQARDAAELARRSGLPSFARAGEVVVFASAEDLAPLDDHPPAGEVRSVVGVGNIRGAGDPAIRVRCDAVVGRCRYDLGPLSETAEFVIEAGPQVTDNEVWDGTQWRVLNAGPTALPRSAIVFGSVLVRARAAVPVLRTARPGEVAGTLEGQAFNVGGIVATNPDLPDELAELTEIGTVQ